MKKHLVAYHVQDGENEYNLYTIVEHNSGPCCIEKAIRNAFVKKFEVLPDEHGIYWVGQGKRAIKIITWTLISEDRARLINEYGIH